DYALFIVNRHRQELRRGTGLHESIALATGTSGNAVVFAGVTVVIALAALNVTGIGFLGLMGTVGAVCVAVAVLVAITLTPALLALAG
ncbi:MMPL family transporter, partial [Xanthomonas citri pv. citri]|nr:MMPL family transporter [Xanthomonas citri pv. citri]